MPFDIEKMQIKDLEEVLFIEASGALIPWSLNMFKGEMQNPFSYCFVMKSTHSTPRSEARGMLRVDTERRFLPRFKNLVLAPSNVSKGESGSKALVVGFICFRNISDESELLNIGVHPHYRQRGLGKILMQFYIDFCNPLKIGTFYLEVNATNQPAIRLYHRFSYQSFGMRKKFYDGKFDAILMVKKV